MTARITAERSSAKASSARTAERSSAKANPVRTLLQITDCHLKAPAPASAGSAARTLLGVDTAASLDAVLAQALAQQRPDAIIASGDLAHDPEPAAYRRLLGLLRAHFDGPVLYLAGNHDLTAPLVEQLGDTGSLQLGGWEVIGFDTHLDHRTEAGFDADRRASLAARLAASPAGYLLLACHHHALPVGCPWLDKDCIPDGRAVLESCAADPRVRGLVFGHVHQEVQQQVHHQARAGVGAMVVLGTPSTCFQFEPRSARFAIDRSEATGRPGYRWLTLQPHGAVDSVVHRVADHHLTIDLSDRS